MRERLREIAQQHGVPGGVDVGQAVTDGGGVILLDGDRLMPGCVCTSGCECPCWQRVGIDDEPCCAGCAPLGGEAPAHDTEGAA